MKPAPTKTPAPVKARGGGTPRPGRDPLLKRALDFVVRYVLPSGVSAGLIVWFFQKVDFHKVMEIIHEGCDMGWILAMMAVTVLNMSSRGVRWGIQLRGVGIRRIPPLAECCSIWGAYALNLLFPRLGEMWRCVYISRREHAPFTTVLGTDIGDRTSDMICVFGMIGLALIFTRSQLARFMDHYAVGRFITDTLSDKWVWIAVGATVAVYVVLVKWFGKYGWVQKMKQGMTNIWTGFAILFRMPQLGLYLWLTLAIWGCYFLETYLCLFAFPFTREWALQPALAYGLKPGLIMMVFSVISTAIPSNGGLGPWTIAVTYALTLFGLSQDAAAAFALVVWGFQQAIIIVMGVFTLLYIMHRRRKEQRLACDGSPGAPSAPGGKAQAGGGV